MDKDAVEIASTRKGILVYRCRKLSGGYNGAITKYGEWNPWRPVRYIDEGVEYIEWPEK